MDTVSTVTRMRQRRRQREPRRLGAFGLGCVLILSLALASLAFLGLVAYRSITEGLPSLETLPALLEPPDGLLLEPTRFYDRSGSHEIFSLVNPAAEGAGYIPVDPERPIHLPAELITATLVAVDPATWAGQDVLTAGTLDEGYDRVAGRLIQELVLQGEPAGLRRTIREWLSVKLVDRQFGREQLMEWYLNSVDFGSLAFGADAASMVYFNKRASELSLAEAAVLAAAAEAPALNPLDTPEDALARGRLILREGLERGLFSTTAFRRAIDQGVTFSQRPESERQPFEAFVELAMGQLEEELGRDRLRRGGLRVRTSLDYNLQLQIDCAVRAQLAHLSGLDAPTPDSAEGGCEAGRLIPALRDLAAGTFEQAGGSAVVMDPKTGEVLALVGEMSAGRPPGTLLTPYVHLAAYTHGFGPASLAWDIPSSLPQALGDFGQGSGQYEGPLRLRTALANDYLGPTLELLDLLGPQEVWESLTQLGFSSTRRDSLNGFDPILGGGEATLLEIVHAYSVFSNLGLLVGEERPVEAGTEGAARIHPVTVLEIGDANGNLIRRLDQTASRPVISAQLAYLITHSLSDEAARWRSLGHPNSLEVGRPAAAKIGTTPVGDDIWTVGFSPNLVAGVWIGETAVSDGTEPVELVGDSASRPSAEAATGLWHAVMQFASGNLPVMDWERPAAVSEVEVCDPSGLLPTAICPAIVSEVFLQGNEPTQLDNLYRKYLVNRETGRLATVFTPPELIEERVYMDIPPDAADWASQSGVETPPIDYDLIFTTSQDVPGVSLHAPPMFAYVRGVIPITGTASGPGFDYYRLQYGQGLNPQSWIQIGDDSSSDLEDGQLGVWDTNGLSGLYAVQLLVVRDDQRVDKATIQVTVDNAAPEVRILNPADGQEYPYTPGRSATLQVQVSDDLSLERVEYFLDDRLLASLAEPPYTLPVPFNPGEHTLRVVAYDRAGNRAEDRISFRVE